LEIKVKEDFVIKIGGVNRKDYRGIFFGIGNDVEKYKGGGIGIILNYAEE
jgi:hypothetical protein